MSISEYNLWLFSLIEHTTDLSHANRLSIHSNSELYFKTQSGISTQMPISLVTVVIRIQHLYMTKYTSMLLAIIYYDYANRIEAHNYVDWLS